MKIADNNEIVNDETILTSEIEKKISKPKTKKTATKKTKAPAKTKSKAKSVKEDKTEEKITLSENEMKFFADLREFQEKYYLINRGGTAMITYQDEKNGLEFMDINTFHSMNLHRHHLLPSPANPNILKKVYVTRVFMENDKTGRYNGIIFDPAEKTRSNYLNLWKGWTAKAKKGNIQPFLDLVDALCNSDKTAIKFLLDYVAHSVQFPEQLPGKCVVFLGEQGTGKGWFMRIISEFCKNNYLHLTDPKLLVGQFTGHLTSAYYLFADEVVWGGDVTAENILKAMITEPTTMINEKHKSAFSTNNYKRIFMASNNEWAAPVSDGDRRYFVLKVNPKYKGQTNKGEFFDLLDIWMKTGGVEALFDFFLTRDLAHFNPYVDQPKTEAWVDLMKMNLQAPYRYIYELLSDQATLSDKTEVRTPEKLVWYRNSLYSDFLEWSKNQHMKYLSTPDSFGKAMTACFKFIDDEPNWRGNWKSAKDGYFYRMPSKTECQKRFSKNFMKAEPELVFFDYGMPEVKNPTPEPKATTVEPKKAGVTNNLPPKKPPTPAVKKEEKKVISEPRNSFMFQKNVYEGILGFEEV